jgi:hypothetical protein
LPLAGGAVSTERPQATSGSESNTAHGVRLAVGVFKSESDEVLAPADLRPGYIIEINGRDFVFESANQQAILVRRYNDPDLVGPPQPVRRFGYFWDNVKSLYVY